MPGVTYVPRCPGQPSYLLLAAISDYSGPTVWQVRNEIYAAFEKIYPVLEEFRKAAEASAT